MSHSESNVECDLTICKRGPWFSAKGVIFFTTALITVFISKIDFVRELALIAFVMEYFISSVTCIMEYPKPDNRK